MFPHMENLASQSSRIYTYFLLCQKCPLSFIFQANFANLLKPRSAMTSSVKSFPAPKCILCGSTPVLHPLVHSHLRNRMSYPLHCLSLLSSPSHHPIVSQRIIFSFLKAANYICHSYFYYHHQKGTCKY